jgi:uncharacterized protein (TIGR02646 family)
MGEPAADDTASKAPQQTSPSLTAARTRRARRDAERFWTTAAKARPQRQYEFDGALFESDEVKAALFDLFAGKCAYCESRFTEGRVLEVDHFRPLYNALDLAGRPSLDHYWWLAYEWANLLPSCVDCARSKGTRFPVNANKSRSPITDASSLSAEKPSLLDPRWDAVEAHLGFLEDGTVASTSERGWATIAVLDLNRDDLVRRRAQAHAELTEEWRPREGAIIAILDPWQADAGWGAKPSSGLSQGSQWGPSGSLSDPRLDRSRSGDDTLSDPFWSPSRALKP